MCLLSFFDANRHCLLPVACICSFMEVPVGFLATLWSFISFLPFFFLLLLLGLLKAVIICPIAACIILVGNSAVVVGLWPAHFLWTCYCVIKSKRLGLPFKVLVILLLPLPLVLWPVLSIVGSLFVGIGYGFFAPLIATFEAVGEQVVDKLFHCFVDGCWSTMKESCTVVRDFTDICFHSYFSFMDELSEMLPEDEKPMDIKISKLPSCLLVSILGIVIDAPLILLVTLWKSPYMLLKGWKRLFEDLIGREGPFLETVCVPFAGLAIILWPLAVLAAVIGAVLCSLFLGFYGGVVVHQVLFVWVLLMLSQSFQYLTNTRMTYFTCGKDPASRARPVYRKTKNPSRFIERKQSTENDKSKKKNGSLEGPYNSTLSRGRSKTLKKVIRQLKPIQVWDWLFRSCELNGRILLHNGLINTADIEACFLRGDCKNLSIKLPAYCILQCLLRSAKSDSPGLLISDDVELTKFNWPEDKVFEWFFGPLVTMKEQIRGLQLDENEEAWVSKLFMCHNNDRPEDWNGSGFPSDDRVRRAQLQAIFRRLQGIVASMSRMPTFRRRFNNLARILYVEALESGLLGHSRASASPGSNRIGSASHEVKTNVEMEEGSPNGAGLV